MATGWTTAIHLPVGARISLFAIMSSLALGPIQWAL